MFYTRVGSFVLRTKCRTQCIKCQQSSLQLRHKISYKVRKLWKLLLKEIKKPISYSHMYKNRLTTSTNVPEKLKYVCHYTHVKSCQCQCHEMGWSKCMKNLALKGISSRICRIEAVLTSKSYFSSFCPGLPDFSWHNIPARGKIYQITTKLPKCPQNIPNDRKIFQMTRIYNSIFHS
jgi:hypothetical protein